VCVCNARFNKKRSRVLFKKAVQISRDFSCTVWLDSSPKLLHGTRQSPSRAHERLCHPTQSPSLPFHWRRPSAPPAHHRQTRSKKRALERYQVLATTNGRRKLFDFIPFDLSCFGSSSSSSNALKVRKPAEGSGSKWEAGK